MLSDVIPQPERTVCVSVKSIMYISIPEGSQSCETAVRGLCVQRAVDSTEWRET